MELLFKYRYCSDISFGRFPVKDIILLSDALVFLSSVVYNLDLGVLYYYRKCVILKFLLHFKMYY